jgi:flagellar capping protein FliD|tara:strand:+ start:443 stop:826 length:384 start_codon:yes stop_codon:yes gene_type:complete
MAKQEKEGFLQKIDPQMWLTLIGFVFTLGIIYGEFQTMKNQIYIFEEKQKSFDEDFEGETKMVLEKFVTLEEKLEAEIQVVEERLNKKIKTINTLEDKVFGITKEIDVEFKKIELQIKALGGHDITK